MRKGGKLEEVVGVGAVNERNEESNNRNRRNNKVINDLDQTDLSFWFRQKKRVQGTSGQESKTERFGKDEAQQGPLFGAFLYL